MRRQVNFGSVSQQEAIEFAARRQGEALYGSACLRQLLRVVSGSTWSKRRRKRSNWARLRLRQDGLCRAGIGHSATRRGGSADQDET
jgi:hypothetical protein